MVLATDRVCCVFDSMGREGGGGFVDLGRGGEKEREGGRGGDGWLK